MTLRAKGRRTDEAFRKPARLVASFYNYYDTKADLLIALAEEFQAEASQLGQRDPSGRRRRRAAARASTRC